jgi:Electron transfer DM13
MKLAWSTAFVLVLALTPACSNDTGGGSPETGGAGGSGASSGGTAGAAGNGMAGAGAGGTAGSAGACSSTNPRVGWTATLSPIEAGVSGTATMVDDCTIRIEHFAYDGSGIEVYVYAGKGGDYKTGFALSGNLLGQSFTDATLTLTLPTGKTLDDVDGIAVWCADVGVSFGDGLFTAP